jgi:hypothetical protein
MMGRSLVAGVVALCLSASVAPAAGQVPGIGTLTAADRSAIGELVEERARSLRDGDRAGFLRTIEGAPGPFRKRQLVLFEGLRSVPLADYRLKVQWAAYGDLARPSDAARYEGAAAVSISHTREAYRIEGFDAKDVYQSLYLTFVERDGEWTVGGDDDLDDLGLFTARSVWDFGPVISDTSKHFINIRGRCTDAAGCGSDVLVAAESALQTVDRFWTQRWRRKVPLIAPASSDDLGRIIQATYEVDNYLAFAFWTGGEGNSAGVRVLVNPSRFDGESAERAEFTLSHELVHVATLPSSGLYMPRFIDEGFAQYVSFGADPVRLASIDAIVAGSGSAELPEQYEFFLGDADGVYRTYLASLSAFSYIAETWGLETFERAYVALGKKGGGPGTAAFHVNHVFERHFGVDRQELERDWASSIAG